MSQNTDTKHKVFISYYHEDDQYYKNKFEELFGHLFINKSVKDGDIDSDLSTDYIKRLIQKGFLTDTSVLVVLIGPNTYKRKHVDWEISAALSKKVGGYSGLLGLCLPEHTDYKKQQFSTDVIPTRLVDNITSGYAKWYDWTTSEANIKKWIQDAFADRIVLADKIDNSRQQMIYNRSK
jgi:hypothetical protein